MKPTVFASCDLDGLDAHAIHAGKRRRPPVDATHRQDEHTVDYRAIVSRLHNHHYHDHHHDANPEMAIKNTLYVSFGTLEAGDRLRQVFGRHEAVLA